MEGLLAWTIMFILADTYWKLESDLKLLNVLLVIGLSILIILHLLTFDQRAITAGDFRKENWFMWVTSTNIGIATFAGLSLPLLFSYNALLAGLSVIALFIGTTRSAWLAGVCGLVVFLWLSFKPTLRSIALLVCIALSLALSVHWLTGKKMPSLDSVGAGSRPQFMLQAEDKAYVAPITGYGLDTQSKYLRPASGITKHRGTVTDRAHFLPLDITLQIGWIGYLLCCAILAKAIHVTWYNRTRRNVACLSVIVSFVVATCMNPSGIPAIALLSIGLFGIQEKDYGILHKDHTSS